MNIIQNMQAEYIDPKQSGPANFIVSVRAQIAIVVVCLFWNPSVNAKEWTITPSAYAGMEYRDNFNLTDTPLEVWRGVFSGAIESDYRTDQGGILFNGRYRGSRYISNTNLNQDEGFINLFGDYTSELNLWEIDAGIALEQPSSSQLEAGNQIFNIISRNRWHIAPSWTRELNAYNDVKLGYKYEDTSYEDIPTITTRFSDYFKHIASTTLTHHFSEYTDLSTIGTYTKTTNDSLRFNSDEYMVQAAVDHKFSDTFNFYFAAGGVWLVSHPGSNLVVNSTSQDTNADFVISLKLEKNFTYTNLSLGYDRYRRPSVSGGYVMRNEIVGRARHEITERLTGLVRLKTFQSDRVNNTLSQIGRQQFSSRFELSWEFLENWYLNGGYQYAWQDLDSLATGPGEQHTVFLTLHYEMSPYFVSP